MSRALPAVPRALLTGTGGLPDQDLSRVDFPRLRSWQFIRGLLSAGVDVWAVLGLEPPAWAALAESWKGGWREAQLEGQHFHVQYVPLEALDRADLPERWCEEVNPTVGVSAGPFRPARSASHLPRPLPVLIDLPGDPMAEALMRVRSSPDPSMHASVVQGALEVQLGALARGDCFTVISDRQRNGTLGQLALMGRGTLEHERGEVLTVPVGVEPLWRTWAGEVKPDPTAAPRVICPGALNTWADLETFFATGERVLAQHSTAVMVVTGGSIPGHEEQAFAKLEQWTRSSPYASRWHLMGWLSAQDAAQEVARATVGLSLDRRGLEPYFGSRTRLLYGVTLNLPWVTTLGCELSETLERGGWVTPVPVGDAEAASRAVLSHLAGNDPQRAPTEALLDPFNPHKLLEKVNNWVQAPILLPPGATPLTEQAQRLTDLKHTLDTIHHSLTWRVMGCLQRYWKRIT